MKLASLFSGARIRLTALTPADLPSIVGWYQDTEFLRLLDARPAVPPNEIILNQWLEDRSKSTNVFLFAIRPVDQDELLGYLEFDEILWNHQTAWISLCIGDRRLWGQGYGTEAMQLGLQFAFLELNLHRVQLTVFSYNERAIALYEKLGFRREGIYREFLNRDNQRFDMYLYGLLRHEWQAIWQTI